MRVLSFIAILILSACGVIPEDIVEKDRVVVEPASYGELKSWEEEDHVNALLAFHRSCAPILKRDPTKEFGKLPEAGLNKDWQGICRQAMALESPTRAQVKLFFERNFKPYSVSGRRGKDKGLFTGYYEASLKGSRQQRGPYQYPLYETPDDLVMVNLGEFRDSLDGERIAGRVVGKQLKPYESRAEIDGGKWSHHDKALVWTDDPIDVFFLHIQGSGVVELDDGSIMRVGYDGHNGHVYYAIGRELVHRGYLAKEDVSMQSIREWLSANPEEGAEIMNTNKSYIFFRELKGAGPIGGSGVALMAGRSLAIDRSLIPYGAPIWVDIREAMPQDLAFRRLMITQDTGGAIRGPVRGDVFWGFGPRAEEIAGQMKAQGRYWLLLPRSISSP